jgi:nucleoside recognition membrane protein YjiH
MNDRPQNVLRRIHIAIVRWYEYSRQTIPLMFIVVATFFFTAFLDFQIQGTEYHLDSHIAAIRQFLDTPYNNLSAFYLFAIYLIAIVQFFNAATFAKKRAPVTLYLLTALTVLQVVLVVLYTSIFFVEQASRTDYLIDDVARFSYTVFQVGAAFLAAGTISAWFFVDWHYVKEPD